MASLLHKHCHRPTGFEKRRILCVAARVLISYRRGDSRIARRFVAVIVCFRVAEDVDPYNCVVRTDHHAARFSHHFCWGRASAVAEQQGDPFRREFYFFIVGRGLAPAVFAVQISSTSSASHKFGTRCFACKTRRLLATLLPTGEGLGVCEHTATPRGFDFFVVGEGFPLPPFRLR